MNMAPVRGVGQQMLTQVGTFPLPPLFIALIQGDLSLDRFQYAPTFCEIFQLVRWVLVRWMARSTPAAKEIAAASAAGRVS